MVDGSNDEEYGGRGDTQDPEQESDDSGNAGTDTNEEAGTDDSDNDPYKQGEANETTANGDQEGNCNTNDSQKSNANTESGNGDQDNQEDNPQNTTGTDNAQDQQVSTVSQTDPSSADIDGTEGTNHAEAEGSGHDPAPQVQESPIGPSLLILLIASAIIARIFRARTPHGKNVPFCCEDFGIHAQ